MYPYVSQVLIGAISRSDHSITTFSEVCGIPYQTFIARLRNPGMWRFCEWQTVTKNLEILEDEKKIINGEIWG